MGETSEGAGKKGKIKAHGKGKESLTPAGWESRTLINKIVNHIWSQSLGLEFLMTHGA